MKKFECDICGQEHEFFGSMILLEPDLLNDMSEEERTKRVKIIDLFYLVDNAFVLTKGDLFIKIKEKDIYMHWEVWVKMDKNEFVRMTENLNGGAASVEGELFVQIPNYRNSLGTKVRLVYDLTGKVNAEGKIDNPEVEVLSSGELKNDFEKGIYLERVINWMKEIYHSDDDL